MKKVVLIVALMCISSIGVSQTAQKSIKDSTDNYVPCTDCFESYKTRTEPNQTQMATPNLNLNNTERKIFGELSRPVKVVLATVGAIFMVALVTKTTNMTNAITFE